MAVQFDNTGDLLSTELGNIGLTAAGFDYFELAPVIEFCILFYQKLTKILLNVESSQMYNILYTLGIIYVLLICQIFQMTIKKTIKYHSFLIFLTKKLIQYGILFMSLLNRILMRFRNHLLI